MPSSPTIPSASRWLAFATLLPTACPGVSLPGTGPTCPASGPLFTDPTSLAEVLREDLNGDGLPDRALAAAPLPSSSPAAVTVLIACSDGEHVAYTGPARALTLHGPKLSGWNVLRLDGVDDAAPARLLTWSLERGAYVSSLDGAREVGCPVFGRYVTQVLVDGVTATVDGKPHRVTWTGDLDGDPLPDHVLIEEGGRTERGELFRVVAGCTEHKGALVLEGAFLDLQVAARTTGFSAVTTLAKDGAAQSWALGDLEVGVYTPQPSE
jgi:hypothetical protein